MINNNELPSKNRKYQLNSFLKRLIIFISALLLTGCGEVGQPGSGPESNGSTQITTTPVSDENDIRTQTEKVSLKNTEEVSQTDNSEIIKSDNFEDAVRLYYEYINNGEYSKVLRAMYPEKVIDSMLESGQITEEMIVEELGGDDKKYNVNSITRETSISGEEKEMLLSSYDQMIVMLEIKSEYGDDLSSLSEDQQKEIQEKFNNTDFENMEHHYTITEGYDVTVNYTSDGKDREDSIYVFYVEGEGWKLQQSMRMFASNVRKAQANVYAKQIFTSCTVDMVELETSGININGTYIICSDDSKNVNVPSEVDTEKVKENIFKTIPQNVSYIMIISNRTCQYVAAFNNNDDKNLFGSYPDLCIPQFIKDGNLKTSTTENNNYTFDELYDIAVNAIK